MIYKELDLTVNGMIKLFKSLKGTVTKIQDSATDSVTKGLKAGKSGVETFIEPFEDAEKDTAKALQDVADSFGIVYTLFLALFAIALFFSCMTMIIAICLWHRRCFGCGCCLQLNWLVTGVCSQFFLAGAAVFSTFAILMLDICSITFPMLSDQHKYRAGLEGTINGDLNKIFEHCLFGDGGLDQTMDSIKDQTKILDTLSKNMFSTTDVSYIDKLKEFPTMTAFKVLYEKRKTYEIQADIEIVAAL